MFDNIQKLKDILCRYGVDYLLVNATNQWLEEEARLEENDRYLLTGFSGDTGDALITKEFEIYLFVDGRYHIQAEQEIKENVKIVKLQIGQRQDEEICKFVKNNSKFGFFSKKISLFRLEKIKLYLQDKNIEMVEINDLLIKQKINKEHKGKKTGCKPRDFKVEDAMFITDLNEIAYLTQIRDFSDNYKSIIRNKLFIDKNGSRTVFSENDDKYESLLKNYEDNIIVDKNTINVYDFNLIKKPIIKNNCISELKSIKTDEEICAMKKAFTISDKSLLEVREYIEKSESGAISEFDICEKLKECFYKYGATGLSFKPIVAINQNSASPHYNASSKDVYLNDGDLVLIDCGIYCEEGLATDTTRVFVKGEPSDLHKKVYTFVLMTFLQCMENINKTPYELNHIAHQLLDNKIDGFVFNHSLGHGVGISVHDGLPSLSYGEIAKQPLKDNMCFTIEPGLYNKDYFGIRLENTFYRNNGKNISFNNLNFEKKLIDYSLLKGQESYIAKYL